MIRPPPTSISLSASDISAHLQHIEINQGLLRQGFKRHEIQRFFRDQNERALEEAGIVEGDLGITPTWVDLVAESRETTHSSRHCTDKFAKSGVRMRTETSIPQDSSEIDEEFSSTVISRHDSTSLFTSRGQHELIKPDRRVSSPASSQIPSSPVAASFSPEFGMEPTRHLHVPRQSSLLRFSSNASPLYREAKEEQVTSSGPHSPRSIIRYKRRTETHPYEHTEVTDTSSSSSFVSIFETLTLDESLVPDNTLRANRSTLRGDAAEFTPLALSFPADYASQASSLLAGSPATQNHDAAPSRLTPYASRIIPTLQVTPESNEQISDNVRSSPPLDVELSNLETDVTQGSPELPAMPSTPATYRLDLSRTEPRAHRNQYLDGPPFIPYNDSLPADFQPQTPADLSRRPFINEFSAAYTDPPGRLHRRHQLSLLADIREMEAGEQSPTTQAIGMRQRRNREFARGARVEGLRINRLRRRIRAGRVAELDIQRNLHGLWTVNEQNDLWRDDLDADRVGEENFEDLGRLADTTGTGVRVISGNRRAHGI